MNPSVTVLVDTYNHERFIEEALVSVVEQEFPASEMEVLVVDDGSTDRTPEIVHKFAPRVRLLRKTNGGQASAFNVGIAEARGQIVAFLDGDDWWARQKLARVAEAMVADPNVGIVGHGITVVYPDGHRMSELLCEGFRFRANVLEDALLLRLRKSFLGTSRMTIRSSLLQKIGLVPDQLRVQADEYLFTLGAVLSNVQILPESLTFYRIHDSNGFLISAWDREKLLGKMNVLSGLASDLSDAFERIEIEPKAGAVLLEVVRAEAQQIRLAVDGGWPWQTASTEWTLYRALRPNASMLHRLFKITTLAMALVLPPTLFYKVRSRMASSQKYGQFRATIFANERPKHVERINYAGRVRS